MGGERTIDDLDISSADWAAAKKFFDSKKGAVKYKHKQSYNQNISFIKIGDTIYAKPPVINKDKRYRDGERIALLGEGGFGRVKMIQDQWGGKFALKIEGRGIRDADDTEQKLLVAMGQLHGQAAIEYRKGEYKGHETQEKLYTVLKLHEGEELFDKLYTTYENTWGDDTHIRKRISPEQKLCLAIKAVESIRELHDKKFLHCDIKPENFMSNMQGDSITVSAIDFGFAQELSKGKKSVKGEWAGSPFYMAPEIYNSEKDIVKFSFASDVYALGVMLKEDFKLESKLIEKMTSKNPSKRPGTKEVLKHLYKELEKQPDLGKVSKDLIEKRKARVVNSDPMGSRPPKKNKKKIEGASAKANIGNNKVKIKVAHPMRKKVKGFDKAKNNVLGLAIKALKEIRGISNQTKRNKKHKSNTISDDYEVSGLSEEVKPSVQATSVAEGKKDVGTEVDSFKASIKEAESLIRELNESYGNVQGADKNAKELTSAVSYLESNMAESNSEFTKFAAGQLDYTIIDAHKFMGKQDVAMAEILYSELSKTKDPDSKTLDVLKNLKDSYEKLRDQASKTGRVDNSAALMRKELQHCMINARQVMGKPENNSLNGNSVESSKVHTPQSPSSEYLANIPTEQLVKPQKRDDGKSNDYMPHHEESKLRESQMNNPNSEKQQVASKEKAEEKVSRRASKNR